MAPIERTRVNVQQFRRGLVFKAQRLLCQSTLGSRAIKKKKSSGRHARERSVRVEGVALRVPGLGFVPEIRMPKCVCV